MSMDKPVNSKLKQRAKELRREQTPTEKKLWRILRNKSLGGFKFRRQHVIGHFIVDFYCHAYKLVIEVDGEIHKQQAAYDQARKEWLKENGYTIIRFKNKEVEQEIKKVKAKILSICQKLQVQ